MDLKFFAKQKTIYNEAKNLNFVTDQKNLNLNTVFSEATNLKLLSLEKFTNEQILELLEITGDPEVMKWVGQGLTWSLDKLKKSVKYAKEMSKLELNARKLIAWGIIADGRVIGYVSLTKESSKHGKPVKSVKQPIYRTAKRMVRLTSDYYDLRIFIGTKWQGRGYATSALNAIKTLTAEYFHSKSLPLISLVKAENIASCRLHVAVGFKHLGHTRMYGKAFEVYRFKSA